MRARSRHVSTWSSMTPAEREAVRFEVRRQLASRRLHIDSETLARCASLVDGAIMFTFIAGGRRDTLPIAEAFDAWQGALDGGPEAKR